jgi:hypothetical protein
MVYNDQSSATSTLVTARQWALVAIDTLTVLESRLSRGSWGW